jgi:hypothetical protein
MAAEHHPLRLERISGTPGGNDATGRVRRITEAERLLFVQQMFGFLAADSLLIRGAADPVGLVVPASCVVGKGATGSLRALTVQDLDGMLGLSAGIATRSPLGHGHAIAEVAGLDAALGNRALVNHLHTPNQIRATTIPDGHVMTAAGGFGSWAPPAGGGGSGGIANPLVANLDIAGHRIVSGAITLLRYAGGRIYLGDCRMPCLDEVSPVEGQVWIRGSSSWLHRALVSGDIGATAITGLAGATLVEQLTALLAALGTKANASHTHAPGEISTTGATSGWVLTNNNGTAVWAALPAIGSGIANPLTAPLNIAAHAIVSGSQELLKYASGKVYVGGIEVFPSAINAPAAGHVPIYDAGQAKFINRFLAAGETSVTAIAGVAGSNVQTMLASLKGLVDEATLTSTDDLDEGATNKYATAESVAAAGAVMVEDISDDETLAGAATDETVSERAIKAYVDGAIAGIGGDGAPRGSSFPGSPSTGDVFFRTDLGEWFTYIGSASAWIGQERSWDHSTGRLEPAAQTATTTGGGAYVFGTGNGAGFRLPFHAFLTGITFQNVTAQATGTIQCRKATPGGAVSDVMSALTLSSAPGGTVSEQLASVDAGEIVSVHASGFSSGVQFATLQVTYRRRVAA